MKTDYFVSQMRKGQIPQQKNLGPKVMQGSWAIYYS